MERVLKNTPRSAIFLAGLAAATLMTPRRGRSGMDLDALLQQMFGEDDDDHDSDGGLADDVKRSLAGMEKRLAALESSVAERFAQVETRLEEHAAKLAEVPSTAQIVGAMEQLLSKAMASLDERLRSQAQSIDVLKTTVSQTDSLLERVLESLDSLQAYADPAELAQDALLQRPAV